MCKSSQLPVRRYILLSLVLGVRWGVGCGGLKWRGSVETLPCALAPPEPEVAAEQVLWRQLGFPPKLCFYMCRALRWCPSLKNELLKRINIYFVSTS